MLTSQHFEFLFMKTFEAVSVIVSTKPNIASFAADIGKQYLTM